jgi:hypothetical protein
VQILLLTNQIKFELLSNIVILKTSVVSDVVHQFIKHFLTIFSFHHSLSIIIYLDLVSAKQLVIIKWHIYCIISWKINYLHYLCFLCILHLRSRLTLVLYRFLDLVNLMLVWHFAIELVTLLVSLIFVFTMF